MLYGKIRIQLLVQRHDEGQHCNSVLWADAVIFRRHAPWDADMVKILVVVFFVQVMCLLRAYTLGSCPSRKAV